MPPDPYQAAVNRIRDTTRWLLTALAAVGAVLLAGLSLTGIGKATGDRLAVAVAAYVVAVLGVFLACGAAVWVIGRSVYASIDDVAGENSYKDARNLIDANSILADRIGVRVAEIPATYKSTAKTADETAELSAAAPADEAKKAAAADALARFEELDAVIPIVLQRAVYLKFRRTFLRASLLMLAAASLATAGIAVFAWAANPPDPAKTTLPATILEPTTVTLTFTGPGKTRWTPALGADCVKAPVAAVALALLDSARIRVAIAQSSSCTASIVDLTFPPADGLVVAPTTGSADVTIALAGAAKAE